MAKLRTLLTLLINQDPLPEYYLDHPLRDRWQGHQDVHIESDWLLLYRINGNELQLIRTGSHSDLFKE